MYSFSRRRRLPVLREHGPDRPQYILRARTFTRATISHSSRASYPRVELVVQSAAQLLEQHSDLRGRSQPQPPVQRHPPRGVIHVHRAAEQEQRRGGDDGAVPQKHPGRLHFLVEHQERKRRRRELRVYARRVHPDFALRVPPPPGVLRRRDVRVETRGDDSLHHRRALRVDVPRRGGVVHPAARGGVRARALRAGDESDVREKARVLPAHLRDLLQRLRAQAVLRRVPARGVTVGDGRHLGPVFVRGGVHEVIALLPGREAAGARERELSPRGVPGGGAAAAFPALTTRERRLVR
eukprot:29120-Pelagococcus_subviridis.AAC.18